MSSLWIIVEERRFAFLAERVVTYKKICQSVFNGDRFDVFFQRVKADLSKSEGFAYQREPSR